MYPDAEGRARAGSGARWVARLMVTDFRNFRLGEIECDERPLVLVGPNGAGKTNLLEAVSLLTPGRGLRRARLSDLPRQGSSNAGGASLNGDGGWAVAARVMTAGGPRELGTGSDPAEEPGRSRRAVKVDGAFAASQQALGEVLAAVWLTPAMDRLFLEGPSARRRFLDRLVYGFEPAHAGRLSAYQSALRERARLLKNGIADGAWLNALERSLAEKGVAIADARRRTLERLAGACAQGIAGFPEAGLGLAGDAESRLETASAVEVEEWMVRRLGESRALDAQTGGAAVGAQRADLAVTHLARGMPAALCSTGEQKALLISIVLAHARLLAVESGAAPLLLLDEVAAHLDGERRARLFEELCAIGAQAWLTGTEATLFDELGSRAQRFVVRDAVVLREA